MLALGRFLQAPPGGGDSVEGRVENLLQRISESALLEDRREALLQLRDVLTEEGSARLAFGSMGFPIVCAVLRDDRDELEMVKAALECIAAATSQDSQQDAQAGAINAEQLARSRDAVPLLLSMLEEEPVGSSDFYVRYHTLQVLQALLQANARLLQEAILGSPLGVVRLMDLLLAEQEVLRNEALLLLQRLAAGHAEVQKIAAFEGAFDRLFGIVREEGGAEGGIVVQDCLGLVAVLLRDNASNQLMFREMGFLSQLPGLLRPPEAAKDAEPHPLPPQQAANMVAGLEVVLTLLAPTGAAGGADPSNVSALMQLGAMPLLLQLSLEGGGLHDSSVRSQALLCLAALAATGPAMRDRLGAATVQSAGGATLSALHASLQAAVGGGDAGECQAASRMLEAYCLHNPAGQAALAASLSPYGGPSSFGGELLAGLQRRGGPSELAASSRAAAALSHMLAGNAELKGRLVKLQLPGAAGTDVLTSLAQSLAAVTAALQQQNHPSAPVVHAAAVGFLQLLLLWLQGCPPAVTAFLAGAKQSPFLVEAITGGAPAPASAEGRSGSAAIPRGLAALLLGICAAHTEAGSSRAALMGVITTQVGMAAYLRTLDDLLQHPALRPGSAGSLALGLSPSFAAWVAAATAEVRQQVTGPMAGSPPPKGLPPPAPAPQPAATSFETLAAPPGFGAKAATAPALPPSPGPQGFSAAAPPTPPHLGNGVAGDAQAQAAADARAAAAEQRASALQQEVERLQDQLAEAEKVAAAARREAAEARAASERAQGELADLSAAYAGLDAHAGQLQAQLDAALAGSSSSSGGGAQPAAPAGGCLSEAEVAARVEAAVAEAQEEGEAAMGDLLICLGQEEAKVARLRGELEASGVDVDGLLADIVAAGEEEEDND